MLTRMLYGVMAKAEQLEMEEVPALPSVRLCGPWRAKGEGGSLLEKFWFISFKETTKTVQSRALDGWPHFGRPWPWSNRPATTSVILLDLMSVSFRCNRNGHCSGCSSCSSTFSLTFFIGWNLDQSMGWGRPHRMDFIKTLASSCH